VGGAAIEPSEWAAFDPAKVAPEERVALRCAVRGPSNPADPYALHVVMGYDIRGDYLGIRDIDGRAYVLLRDLASPQVPTTGVPAGAEFAVPLGNVQAVVTRASFEQAYAERSAMAVDRLRSAGRVVVACDCDDAACTGFASVSRTNALEDGLRILESRP
jgi:hypothetical protein